MKIKFTSGSPNNFDNFDYFNYQISSIDNTSIDISTKEPTGGNGVDAGGQGIYGFSGIAANEAARYAGSDGCLYVCSAEIGRFANDVPATEIEYDDWRSLIDVAREKIHELYGYNEQQIRSEAEELDFEDESAVKEFLEKHEEWLSDVDYEDYGDGYDFVDGVVECLSMHSPTSNMDEELVYFDLQENINSSSIWELHGTLGHLLKGTSGNGNTYYNKCYYDAFKEVIGSHPDYTAGIIRAIHEDDTDVIICFDLDKISIDKKIDLSKRKSKENDATSLDR